MEEFGLAGQGLFIGAQDFAFFGAKFFGREALGVHHGLLTNVVGWDRGQVRFGNLDRVAESAVVADLERSDTRAGLLLSLEVSNPGLTVGG